MDIIFVDVNCMYTLENELQHFINEINRTLSLFSGSMDDLSAYMDKCSRFENVRNVVLQVEKDMNLNIQYLHTIKNDIAERALFIENFEKNPLVE